MSQNKQSLSFYERFLLSVLGANKELAEQNWEDGPILTTLALQLIGTFVLLFCLQAAAFTVLSGELWIGLLVGFVTASLIISADRILISGDWYMEGEYWHLFHKNPDNPRLKEIARSRYIKMAVRYAIGIIVSISVVTIATPTLFIYEIDSELTKDNFTNENQEAIKRGAEITISKKEGYQAANEYVDTIKNNLDAHQNRLKDLLSSSANDPEIANIISQIATTREEISIADKARIYAEDRREQERLGIISNRQDDKGIEASGKAGCKQRCLYWDAQAKNHKERSDELKADLENLETKLSSLRGNTSTQRQSEIDRVREQITKLQQDYDDARLQVENARNDWINHQNEYESKIGIEYGIPYQKAGLKRTMNAYDDVLSSTQSSGRRMLDLLKIFAVFLETIVFTSKLFGTSRNYSCAVYEHHQAKWSKNSPLKEV